MAEAAYNSGSGSSVGSSDRSLPSLQIKPEVRATIFDEIRDIRGHLERLDVRNIERDSGVEKYAMHVSEQFEAIRDRLARIESVIGL